jgi:hypothetical protein
MVARILAPGLSVIALAVPSTASQAAAAISGGVTASARAVANAVVWLEAGVGSTS